MERSVSLPLGHEILALFLAALGALCLIFQFILGWAGAEIVFGSLAGWACAVGIGCLSTRPKRERLCLGVGLIANCLLPLTLLWQAPVIGMAWMLAGAISLNYITSLVRWVAGVHPAERVPATRSFRLTVENTPHKNPVPGCMVTGVLAFAIPLPNPLVLLLAAGYLASLLALASLGALETRRREETANMGVSPAFLTGWANRIAGLLLLILLAGAGGVGATRFTQARLFPDTLAAGGRGSLPFRLPIMGDGAATGKIGSGAEMSGNAQGRIADGNNGKGQRNTQLPSQPRSLSEMMPLLQRLLPLLLAGLALAFILTRYGAVLIGWLQYAGARFLRLLSGGYRAGQARLAAKRREAAVRAIMAALPDPYAPVTDEDMPEILFRKWVESAVFFGIHLREKDGIYDFAYQFERLDAFPANEIQLAARICSQSIYGVAPPDPERISQVRQFVEHFQQTAMQQISADQLAQRREERLHQLAVGQLAVNEAVRVDAM